MWALKQYPIESLRHKEGRDSIQVLRVRSSGFDDVQRKQFFYFFRTVLTY